MVDNPLSDFVTLFVTIDPVGTVPIFLAVCAGTQPRESRRMAMQAVLIAGGVLLGFVFLGQLLLQTLHIEMVSFQISGGLILFLIAMSMLFGYSHGGHPAASPQQNPAIFPLAMPIIAGPGAILAAVVLTDNDRHNLVEQAETVAMIVAVLVVQWVILLAASRIQKWIGQSGTSILSRVMGLILAAMSVETIVGAVRALMHTA